MNTSSSEHTCKSCGTVFRGRYCNNCGEKVLEPGDASFAAFLQTLWQSLTLTDGKVVRTLWMILRKPGFVSREFVTGRSVYFVRPLSLFFALNLIYFLFPLIQLFNASLKTQLNGPLQVIMRNWVANAMIREHILSVDSFSLIYDQKTAGLAKLIVMVFVIIASLPLNLLYRKKGLYFMSNLTLMTELVCFNLFVNAIFLTLVLKFTGIGHYTDDHVLTWIFVVTNLYFLVRAGQIFYGEKSWRLLVKPAVMLVVLKVSLDLYRVILFFVTLIAI